MNSNARLGRVGFRIAVPGLILVAVVFACVRFDLIDRISKQFRVFASQLTELKAKKRKQPDTKTSNKVEKTKETRKIRILR